MSGQAVCTATSNAAKTVGNYLFETRCLARKLSIWEKYVEQLGGQMSTWIIFLVLRIHSLSTPLSALLFCRSGHKPSGIESFQTSWTSQLIGACPALY